MGGGSLRISYRGIELTNMGVSLIYCLWNKCSKQAPGPAFELAAVRGLPLRVREVGDEALERRFGSVMN
jgi:hypothetical protein